MIDTQTALEKRQHSTLDTRDNLLAIANHWPELTERLTPTPTGTSEVHTPAGPRVPIDAHVSDVITDITTWANFLAKVLVDETDWTPPANMTVPTLLRTIARDRIGHFTQHPDEMVRLTIHDDATEHRRTIERTCRPQGTRTVRTGIPCTTTPCDGQYAMRITPGQDPMTLMTCTRNRDHTLNPDAWTEALRRNRGNQEATRQELTRHEPHNDLTTAM